MFDKKLKMPSAADALKGRAEKMPVPPKHHVLNATSDGPYPTGTELAMFGLGCFWGAEKKFWQVPGVYTTAVGYAAGVTPNPTYREVCTGMTGHNEVVLSCSTEDVRTTSVRFLGIANRLRDAAGNASHAVTGPVFNTTDAQRRRRAPRDEYQRALAKSGHGRDQTDPAAPDFYPGTSPAVLENPDGYAAVGTGLAAPSF